MFKPQQTPVPSLRIPQLWGKPALTWLKLPAGGEACPKSLLPQQANLPSLFTPQVWSPPALTWVKLPAGGVASPLLLSPQQANVPSLLTPQVWSRPALILTGVAACATGGATLCSMPTNAISRLKISTTCMLAG